MSHFGASSYLEVNGTPGLDLGTAVARAHLLQSLASFVASPNFFHLRSIGRCAASPMSALWWRVPDSLRLMHVAAAWALISLTDRKPPRGVPRNIGHPDSPLRFIQVWSWGRAGCAREARSICMYFLGTQLDSPTEQLRPAAVKFEAELLIPISVLGSCPLVSASSDLQTLTSPPI